MEEPIYLNKELREQWRITFENARADREGYFLWIKNEIQIVITLINKYDKIYLLGGLGAMLLKSSPNFYNQFLEMYEGPDKDLMESEKMINDESIEVLLEYAMSIASASNNTNKDIIPNFDDIEEVKQQLFKIKFNIGFYEMSAENPVDGNEFDNWIKLRVMNDDSNIRGDGYHSHIEEIYKEIFAPHDDFLLRFYGFNSSDILDVIGNLDTLVYSKVGNAHGGFVSQQRFEKWSNEKGLVAIDVDLNKGISPNHQFTIDNPDLFCNENPDSFQLIHLDDISGYDKLFWVIPKGAKEKKIFELLSHNFGDNQSFLEGRYKGFPQGDSVIFTKPLIRIEEKFYCFSVFSPFRNMFGITANLLEQADAVYYEHSFKGNANVNSRDNYIEKKAKELFERFLTDVQFYHSLNYKIIEDGIEKNPELDILGIGENTLYIIEVKAGELNKKHKRGAILGLKQRLKETVNEGSYQCFRAETFIKENSNPEFNYVDGNQRMILIVDKEKEYDIIKISVTFEHFSAVSVNLKYLIESGVLSESYKWTWIISLYDLMIFSELVESERDFKEYIQNRLNVYERDDLEFNDEIDILAFFFENKFPVPKQEGKVLIEGFKKMIDDYYNAVNLGMPNVNKPKRKRF